MTCTSVIICDDIYRDESTKKLIIVGTFNQIFAPEFPHIHETFRVLFTITNGRGKYELELSIDNAATGDSIVTLSGPIELSDPLQMRDINVDFRGAMFQEPGKYLVTIKADGEPINQRPFFVKPLEEAPPSITGEAG